MYRLSDARRAVVNTLGQSINTTEGSFVWNVSGENALGTQLVYLNAYQQWLDSPRNVDDLVRGDLGANVMEDYLQRPFPFRHKQLWADSDTVELERYRKVFTETAKVIMQADVAGVRNGLDHQRDRARFPTNEQLLLCVTRLKTGVGAAEKNRIYPVIFWLDSRIERASGAKQYDFRNSGGDIFSIHRPSTVGSMPGIPSDLPVVFAPVNFLGAADSLLSCRVMGESDYSRYWSDYPRIAKVLPEKVRDEITTDASRGIEELDIPTVDESTRGSVEDV